MSRRASRRCEGEGVVEEERAKVISAVVESGGTKSAKVKGNMQEENCQCRNKLMTG